MAIAYNPRIVTDNLVFAYDAANVKSYPGSGTAWNDLSGNGYHATKTGARVSYSSAESAWEFTGTSTVSGQGLYISGLNYVSGSSDAISNLTIESWIKCTSGGTGRTGDERIILSFDRSAVFRFGIGYDNANVGKPFFSFISNNTQRNVGSSTSYTGDLRDDAWHQVSVTFDTSSVKFYIDGTLVHTSTASYGTMGGHTETESPRYGWIGNGSEAETEGASSTSPNHLFYGFISKINYYYKTLSDSEIAQNFNASRGRYGI